MNMFWNRKLSSARSNAVLHILRAATVAAVVSSCFTSAEAQEQVPPPLVLRLDPAAKCEPEATLTLVDAIKEYAWRAYQEFSGSEKSAAQNTITGKEQLLIVDVTISYKDANTPSDERLLSLAVTVPDPTWKANLQTLRIPRFQGPNAPDAFEGDPGGLLHDVHTRDTGSPDTITTCRRISGSQYSCSF